MSCLLEHHFKLNEQGEGKCSVPMWSGGGPCGFCDEPAFGFREPTRYIMNYPLGQMVAEDCRYSGYVPALACPSHGGPKVRVFKDGSSWCAAHPDFINIQESDCAFADTPEEAKKLLKGGK